MRALGSRVVIGFRAGVIVGRTIEQQPRYDIRTDDGRLIQNVPALSLDDEEPLLATA